MKKIIRQRKSFIFFILTLVILLACFCKVNGETKLPSPTSLKYVNDYSNVLNDKTKNYIVSLGSEIENKTGAQEVIVIVDSLQGNEIRDYGNKLFRNWGIGQKEKDNGLLILLSMKDRKWSIEVGRGLEGAIPDVLSNRIMESVAVPEFRNNDFDKGLSNAYTIFGNYIGKEYNVTLEKNENIQFDYENAKSTKSNPIPIYIIIGLVLLDIIFNRGRIIRFILEIIFWNSFFKGGRGGGLGGGSGGGFGGFGGGSSSGGGSSGNW